MVAESWSPLVAQMKHRGIEFDAGLTDAEVARIEGQFAFRFPPDLREFLQTALPRGERFPTDSCAAKESNYPLVHSKDT
jgi:hypothetical protein